MRRHSRFQAPIRWMLTVTSLSWACTAVPPGAWADPSDAGVEKLELQLRKLEAAMSEPDAKWPEREERQVAAKLDERLKQNPDDVDALIFYARLGMVRHVHSPSKPVIRVTSGEKSPVLGEDLRPYIAALDRALAHDSTRFQAYYVKWSMCMSSVPVNRDGDFTHAYVDLPEAIRTAHRVVDLAPQNDLFRENLAVSLCADHRPDEAIKVIRSVNGGAHPLHVLLKEWETVPLPPGAVLWPAETDHWSDVQSQNVQDFAEARTRVYACPLPAAGVEAFYRERWPAFRLFAVNRGGESDSTDRYFVHRMACSDAGFVPTRSREDAEVRQGLMVSAREVGHATPEEARKPPIPATGVYCELALTHFGCPSGRGIELMGTYEMRDGDGSMTIEFKSDHRVRWTMQEGGGEPQGADGDYRTDGNQVTIHIAGGSPLVLTRSGAALEGAFDGRAVRFKKK